jgi:hypothetical protein
MKGPMIVEVVLVLFVGVWCALQWQRSVASKAKAKVKARSVSR